ncbi:DNA (cytosine-5-)-methyltransferase 3 beta, duplicate a [Nematolebias whitei]|uniref:DNA (cytosine-5-)-methyltransferase 3 beta, duplicate a n=1 Tax=Nematolebias whitei TaxID=451745 RepID=UPI00189C06F5|nr:DNA (cytosine-5-)-methyltransferase 3 beta, duplicate a [Nematolebias whitei]
MPGPVVTPDSSQDKSSRQHVVFWFNRLLETHFKDVQEMASGACHCQIMDCMFPGSVDLTKVKFDAQSEDDCKHNFSLLQDAFTKKSITKAIPVDDLIKRDSKSNYDFLKWLKVLHAANEHDEEYDPVKARNGQKISPLLVSRQLRSSKVEPENCELESKTRSNDDVTASKTFPYSEKWKKDFNWAGPSPLGEQYTFCSFCHANLCTFQTGCNELKQHENTNKHNKNADILLSQDQLNEPLPCSDAAVQFIHSHCYSGTAGGEQAAEHLARCKLGWQYPQNIRSVCQHTPYCVYIYKGVPMGKNDMVSVVLVGYFDIEASSHCIQFLDALQSDGPGEQTDAVVVQTLKKFDLPTDNLAVYFSSNGAASEQTCSHLRELNQNVLALGGLYTVADAACLAGVKELSSQTQDFMAELHAHYSSCCTNNDKLKVLFGSDISENNKPFYLNTSCLTFCQFVTNILDMWADLLLHFNSCHKYDDKAKLVCSLMKNPKVKATFMFLDQALKPLQKYQRETQGASWASMPLILEEASTLLGTYTSHFLQPHAATCYLEEHNAKILQNKKFHLSSLGFSLGKKPSEDADTLSQLREEALLFYIAVTDCISKELPLSDMVLKSIAQLLTPQKGLKVTKAVVGELGTSLGVCSSPKEVQQLTREFHEYWLAEDKKSKDEAQVSLEEHWTRVLKDIKSKSMFRKLVLTLLSFPCPPLDAQHVVTQALQNGDSVIFAESEAETGSDCDVTPDGSPSDSSKDSQTHSGKTNDPRALLKACEVRLSRINYPFDALSTKGTSRGRSGLRNSLRQKPQARTMFQAGVCTWSKPIDLNEDFRAHKSRDEFDEQSLKNITQIRGRSKEYQDEKGFLTGELLWGKVKGFSWWPGMVVAWKSKCPPPGMRRVVWFGDGMFSEVHVNGLLPFEAFSRCFCKNSFTSFPVYREAIYQIIELASVRCRKLFSQADGNKEKQLKLMVDWAFEGFLPTGPKGFSPPASSPRSESPESAVSDYQPPQKRKYVSKNKAAASAVTYSRESLIKKIKEEDKTIEDFCLSCASPEVEVPHPLFEGGLCLKCKVNFTETLYRYDEDGYQSYCTVCCAGTEVVLCSNSSCCRCFCKDCLNLLVTEGTFDKIQEVDPWSCYICVPSQCEGHLKLRPDWSVKLQDFFANDSAMEFEPHRVYPCVPAEQRRPLRVLSLFDGIATGYLVLKELGFRIERYVASEICNNSITVGMVKHNGKIEYVDDARAITRRHLAEWGPFDLLIGGSPCNDLSMVNPQRKGLFEGTGRLFFEYYRILNILKPKEEDNRPFFWLFENVVFMSSHDKSDICRFLECNPVLVNAVKVSPAHRARYFWGNIPGMNRPITASQSDKVILQECLEVGRKAMTEKIRTVTSHAECMKLGKKGPLPVTMNGKEDYLWSSELEMVFGFPKHYTDVNHMSRTCRQKILGKSWSVPVIRHLLSPLKDYFECEAGQ